MRRFKVLSAACLKSLSQRHIVNGAWLTRFMSNEVKRVMQMVSHEKAVLANAYKALKENTRSIGSLLLVKESSDIVKG